MADTTSVIGVFNYTDALEAAIGKLREHGWRAGQVYSPVPCHRIERMLEPQPSSVRAFALLGGAFGAIGGVALAIWSSLKWNLITGGKPIVSIPPFLVIGFELALLFGAIGTVIGFLINARLSPFQTDPHYDPRFSDDHYGLLITGPPQEQALMVEYLWHMGAKEVRVDGAA